MKSTPVSILLLLGSACLIAYLLIPAREPVSLKPPTAPVQVSEDQVPRHLPFEELRSRYFITGTFGHPIGSSFTVRCTIKGSKGPGYIEVSEVDGAALEKPAIVPLARNSAYQGSRQTYTLVGFETIAFYVPRFAEPRYTPLPLVIRAGATLDLSEYHGPRIGAIEFVIQSTHEPSDIPPKHSTKKSPPHYLPFADFPSRYVIDGSFGHPICKPFTIRGKMRSENGPFIEVMEVDGRPVAGPIRVDIADRPFNVELGEVATFVGYETIDFEDRAFVPAPPVPSTFLSLGPPFVQPAELKLGVLREDAAVDSAELFKPGSVRWALRPQEPPGQLSFEPPLSVAHPGAVLAEHSPVDGPRGTGADRQLAAPGAIVTEDLDARALRLRFVIQGFWNR